MKYKVTLSFEVEGLSEQDAIIRAVSGISFLLGKTYAEGLMLDIIGIHPDDTKCERLNEESK